MTINYSLRRISNVYFDDPSLFKVCSILLLRNPFRSGSSILPSETSFLYQIRSVGVLRVWSLSLCFPVSPLTFSVGVTPLER